MAFVDLRGAALFRHRLVCSLLSGTPIRIDEIRALDQAPGIRDYEATVLRLLDAVTNGCGIDISETGTRVRFRPGIIVGGRRGVFDCGTDKSIGYFLELLLCIAPFGKKPLEITLTGITNSPDDPSVDTVRNCMVRVLKRFGVPGDIEVKITKRGAPPRGGGQVSFKCPIVKTLTAVDWMDPGKIRRIRGIAYSTRVSPQINNRVVDSARAVLQKFVPDVYLYSDHYKGAESGLSSGYALSLVAESTTGCALSAEAAAQPGELPEEVGEYAARLMIEEIFRSGCVDSTTQTLTLLLMVLCPEDVSTVRVGKLTDHAIAFLRLARSVFGVTFKIETDTDTKTLLMTCRGVGFKNIARKQQ